MHSYHKGDVFYHRVRRADIGRPHRWVTQGKTLIWVNTKDIKALTQGTQGSHSQAEPQGFTG